MICKTIERNAMLPLQTINNHYTAKQRLIKPLTKRKGIKPILLCAVDDELCCSLDEGNLGVFRHTDPFWKLQIECVGIRKRT